MPQLLLPFSIIDKQMNFTFDKSSLIEAIKISYMLQ